MRERDARGQVGRRRNFEKALRQPDERRARAGLEQRVGERGERRDRRRRDEEVGPRGEGEVGGRCQRVRQRDAGQVTLVAARLRDCARERGVAGEQRDGGLAPAREVRGERCSPSAGAEDCDGRGGRLLPQGKVLNHRVHRAEYTESTEKIT
jgi:hypothetical protein